MSRRKDTEGQDIKSSLKVMPNVVHGLHVTSAGDEPYQKFQTSPQSKALGAAQASGKLDVDFGQCRLWASLADWMKDRQIARC